MAKQDSTGPAQTKEAQRPLTPEERQERKQRVLTQGQPSVTRSIAEAVVIKDGNVFFLTTQTGSVPLDGDHGFGMYYHDCRYLCGYRLQLGGTDPTTLVASAAEGYRMVLELTNADIRLEENHVIHKETVGITWERTLDGLNHRLHDKLRFKNFGLSPISMPVTLEFNAGFEDVFTVRELLDEHPGELREPRWDDGALNFIYAGADGLYRSVSVFFSPQPEHPATTTAQFQLQLEPRGEQTIAVTLVLAESRHLADVRPAAHQPNGHQPDTPNSQRWARWREQATSVRSDSLLLNRILNRSLLDLQILRSSISNDIFFAAGIPWFATLFGRDSLITTLQTLVFNPDLAEQTLRLLAKYQGQKVDSWRDEQPGKILHELRVGELAHLREIPHTPYYGTVDATPLFLILMARHAAWTGSLTVFEELHENVERAIRWMDDYGDANGDGYIEYESHSAKGLINQGWKDSGNAIVNADGSLANPPISLVEVQGYAYWARLAIADLFERAGDNERAQQLRQKAEELRQRFNREFWLEDLSCYALALESNNQPCRVVSSNPGHALWANIADEDKARRTVRRLMEPDMFNGWGVRTLSHDARAYNPIGYHLGTVWPHDNAIIAAGFRRYGCDDEAMQVFTAIIEAAMTFDNYRLPELFAGFARDEYSVPVHYPVACHPQAWAAGSVPYLMEVCLGLQPEAFERRLRIVRPLLPQFVDRVELRGLRVGQAHVDLRFTRRDGYRATAEVVKRDGELEVTVEETGR